MGRESLRPIPLREVRRGPGIPGHLNHIYTYIYAERETHREKETEGKAERKNEKEERRESYTWEIQRPKERRTGSTQKLRLILIDSLFAK